jgi:hypothetical protein
MKNQAVLLVFAALFSASIAATVPWGFNCTAVVSNDNWQCGSDFAIPDLASQLVVVVPNNSAINDYGVKICIQNRLSLANPSRWTADSCTYYQEIAPVETAPVSVPVEAPKAEPVAAPVEAPKAEPVAAPVEAPKAEPVAAPVEAPKAAFMFSAVNAHGFLASGRYVIGVAFVKPPTGNFSHPLSFQLTGSVCDGKFGDFACTSTPVQGTFNGNVSFNLAPGASDSFTAQINNVLYGSITIKTNAAVGLHLRRDAYPFVNPAEFAWNDANSENGELVIKNPAPGDYLIGAMLAGNANGTDFSFEASAKVCNASANVAGPDCDTSVVELASASGQLYDGTAGPSMVYYKLKVDLLNKTRLSFSVASKTSAPTPRVYVRWGNLPDENNYDYVGCSTEYCAVNQVDLEILTGSAGDWYIGVSAAPNTSDSYAFGIWHGSVCPNNCGGDHGTCNTEGEKMGTCSCAEGFTAIDCSETAHSGLSPEMIVLIVMGALVVLSAVIGFIAWAYMRRKRVYEEIQ